MFSFEFFPPKDPAGHDKLCATADALARFEPAFMSVTYGAGGSTRDRTIGAIGALRHQVANPIAGHLTCVGGTIEETHEVVDRYLGDGVDHIVALRGDLPEDGVAADGYPDAASLVAGLRARPDGDRFEISVAAYPEVHPMATSAQADLDNLRRKLDAGADRAITQFFFDTDAFLRFRDTAVAAGITKPIVPGIMPVASVAGAVRFAGRCGTNVPQWFIDMFDGLDDQPEVRRLVAATVSVEQCQRLRAEGVDSFHFYTLNNAELTSAICRVLSVTEPRSGNAPRRAA